MRSAARATSRAMFPPRVCLVGTATTLLVQQVQQQWARNHGGQTARPKVGHEGAAGACVALCVERCAHEGHRRWQVARDERRRDAEHPIPLAAEQLISMRIEPSTVEMDAAVNLDHEPCGAAGKVSDKATDDHLPPEGDAEPPAAELGPEPLLGGCLMLRMCCAACICGKDGKSLVQRLALSCFVSFSARYGWTVRIGAPWFTHRHQGRLRRCVHRDPRRRQRSRRVQSQDGDQACHCPFHRHQLRRDGTLGPSPRCQP
jgi:hypothetical protein